MRKGTKSFVGILSLGLVAAGYQAGQAAEISNGFGAAAQPLTSSGSVAPIATSTAATATAAATPATSAAAAVPTAAATSAAQAATPAKASTSVSTPRATATPPVATTAPVSTPKATTAPAPAAAETTKSGSAINYRYGTVQVSVTKANGKITAVNLLQAGASGGRQGAFSYLVSYAIQANGTSFGNLSGATFTTDAFKQSLESALAKF
ncbi:MAG: FMN-binding protein [Rhodoluna sp.]